MASATEEGGLSAAELFREHAAFVARFLFRLGVPADAIQDTVQEVFLVVHQRGGYRPGAAKPTSYLAVIAANAASAQRRKARAQSSRFADARLDELCAQAGNPELRLETQDSLRRLQAALNKLEPELRATLLLADGEDETCASIAQAMGVPVGTVYWRLHEARKKFQRALAAVDAAMNRPRVARAAADEPTYPAPVFARTAKMLSVLLGFLLPSWRGSEAHALVRATAKQMPVPYDLQAGLLRHPDAVARLPAARVATASTGLLGSAAGAAKTSLLVATGGAALVTALQLLSSQRSGMMAPAVATARPLGPSSTAEVAAPIAAPEPAQLDPYPVGAELTQPAPPTAPRTFVRSTKGAVRTTKAARSKAHAIGSNTPEPTASQASTAEPVPAPHAPTLPPASQGNVEVMEAQALGRAESLLTSDPAQALAIVRKVAAQSQSDYLREERQYIEVMALHGLHRSLDAARAAEAFLKTYPQSMFAPRVKRAQGGATD